MAATTGYQVGVETNNTQLSYMIEAAWGTAPGATAAQAIRYTSESLSFSKTRQRPGEINASREVLGAVTTQQQASGSISFALSYLTYDDFFSVALGNDWGAFISIAGIAADITLTQSAGVVTISSTLGTKFSALVQGQWIRTMGFTNANNNDYWYISVKSSNQLMTLTGRNQVAPNAAVTETPAGTAAQVRGQTVRNGTQFKSLYIQQKLSATQWVAYPGSYVTKIAIQGGVGSFMSGSIDIVSQREITAASDASTGVTAAPSGRILDPVNGWVAALWNEAILGTVVDQFSITIENTQSAPEFAMGSAVAAGILAGTFQATASFRAYFATTSGFTQYLLFQNETQGRMSFIIKDSTGVAYAFTFLNANLLGQIQSGGPGQPVYATFSVEGGPQAAGGTLVIDKLAISG